MEKYSYINQIFFNSNEIILILPKNASWYKDRVVPKNVKVIRGEVFERVESFVNNFQLYKIFDKQEHAALDTKELINRTIEVLTILDLESKEEVINSFIALGFINHASKS